MTIEKAPEKIWTTGNERTGSWNAEEVRMKAHMPDGWQTEYTRSDIAEAEVKRLEEEILTLNRLVGKLYIDIAERWIV
tara:strand:+ start:1943 stop:2176 length:234 start_codon:yes stop_codon:yes gene_type:complete